VPMMSPMSLMSPYTPDEVYRTATVALPGLAGSPTDEGPRALARPSAPIPAAAPSSRLIDWSKAPSTFLRNLFHLLVFGHAGEKCPACRRPYYWVLASPQSQSLRLVCRQWRAVFLRAIVIPINRARLYVCSAPLTCLAKHWTRIDDTMRRHKRFYIVIDQPPGALRQAASNELLPVAARPGASRELASLSESSARRRDPLWPGN
jgi:hypothetical protein